MAVVEPFGRDELGVRGPQILACVFVRSAERHRHERDLLLDLRVHLEVLEERRERRIGHHTFVEIDHGRLDGGFAAEAVEQGFRARRHSSGD